MPAVVMTCMTTKQKFDVENPEVVVLKIGRYAFRAECPWEGKNGKKLTAFKFCSAADYQAQSARLLQESAGEGPEEGEEQSERPESASDTEDA